MLRFALSQTLIIGMLMTPVSAASPEQRGKVYVQAHCAQCHSIDRVTKSRLPIAPPFRTLHLRYPIEMLAESLAEGISAGHPAMPSAELNPDQIHDVLSYLKTLE